MSPMDKRSLTRLPHLACTDRAELDRLLDDAVVGHFAFAVEQRPVAMPTAIARDGDRILAHGSTGSGWMRVLARGVPASLAVTSFEGLVVARSAFESSMIYRSAVLFGSCQTVEDPLDKERALDVLTEAFLPGRADEIRRPTTRELAATLVLSLPIAEWSLKISAGWPDDPEDDVAGPSWAGLVPMSTTVDAPRTAPDLTAGIPVPASVIGLLRRGSRP
jgi:nitroimidazol reductase NimA-like FMN-containing flavoprotein (pyridoxamine 5'-phosphate oxidase superfamily)